MGRSAPTEQRRGLEAPADGELPPCWTARAAAAIERAGALAAEQGYERPHPRHLLLSLLEDSRIVDLLHGAAEATGEIRTEILESLQRTSTAPVERARFSGVGFAALLRAATDYLPAGAAQRLDAEQILLGLVSRDPQSAWILNRFGTDHHRLRSAVEARFKELRLAAQAR